MAKKINLTGQTFGRLTVIGEAGRTKYGAVLWECKCSCGNIVTVERSHLRSGRTVSCGCYHSERNREITSTHGGSHTRLYKIHEGMKTRCLNKNNPGYTHYSARGITICKEWLDFTTFRDWALSNGYDDTLSIDRIDVNGDYCPKNCRWVTTREQCDNKQNTRYLTFNDETHTIREWARKLNVSYQKLYLRLTRYGWSIEKALNGGK